MRVPVRQRALDLGKVVCLRRDHRLDRLEELGHAASEIVRRAAAELQGPAGPIFGSARTQPSGGFGHNAVVKRGLALVALALALSQAALAVDVPLSTRLASALAVRGNSWATSAALAVDLQSDGVVFARNPDLSLAPASNEKLPVTYAALRELGLSYRFKTEVLGRGTQEGTVWHGDLFLKGFGDPTLTSARLGRLARAIAEAGSRASTDASTATSRGSTRSARRRAGSWATSSTNARRSRRSSSTARSTRVTSPSSRRSPPWGRSAGCCEASA